MTKREKTVYSERVQGARGNYRWPVVFDITAGYLGISQFARYEGTARVLLSPAQVKALLKFIKESK